MMQTRSSVFSGLERNFTSLILAASFAVASCGGDQVAETAPKPTASINTLTAEESGAFSFPPEWEPHEAVWMGWGSRGEPHPERFVQLWTEIITALTPHVPVKLVTGSEESAEDARTKLGAGGVDLDRVQIIIQPWTDYWFRDFGPLFVTDGKTKKIAEFRWASYGFPAAWQSPDGWANGTIDRNAAETFGYGSVASDMVGEGGGIEVSSSVLISYKDAMRVRNPQSTADEIAEEYLRLYGKEKMVWLSRAPVSDRVMEGAKIANFFGYGANGHVDEYVRFVDEETIFVAHVSEEERDLNELLREDYEILEDNFRELTEATNINGEPFRVVKVPMPDVTALMQTVELTEDMIFNEQRGQDNRSIYRNFEVGDEIHWLPAASYLNFLITNNVVLVAKYWEEGLPERLRETDEKMRQLLAEQFPDREIIQINPLAINWLGGGMHCITQQEPLIVAQANE